MADFQSHIEEFKKENVDIVALSVDPLDKARETVEDFILDADKKVVDASYSIGPIGRIVAGDALSHIQFFKKRKAQQS